MFEYFVVLLDSGALNDSNNIFAGEPCVLDQKVIILHKSIISHDNIKSINKF